MSAPVLGAKNLLFYKQQEKQIPRLLVMTIH